VSVSLSSPAILSFTGPYEFCSNFGPGRVHLAGVTYPRREHAFHAHKSPDPAYRQLIAGMDDSRAGCLDAKKAGRRVLLRTDWEQVKKAVMLQVVLGTFLQNPGLADRLAGTGDAWLAEGNRHHDNYWGSCTCPRCGDGDIRHGLNYLGRILAAVRDVVRAD
jgi:ribA/ribD-fused uncharacterized protein